MLNNPILSVKNLSVAFGGNIVVDHVSFSIMPGETVALVGESGSGKSLTALSIMQLLPLAAHIDPNSVIDFSGQDLLTFPETLLQKIRGNNIGMIFQEAIAALNPVLTIGEQIFEVLSKHTNLPRKKREERAVSILEEVGLPDAKQCLKSYAHQLSGGMRQRAMIAIALAAEPKLLIADEPTTALDVTIQKQVLDLIKHLQKKHNMSVLFITHDLGVVQKVADKVVVMQRGRVVEACSASQFFRHPQHEYSQHLFNSIPGLHNREKPVDLQPSEPLLEVQNLKVYYPIRAGIFKRVVGHVKAVDGVSFELQRGKTLALVGESGSGKTTAGMGVLQLLKTTSGEVLFQGEPLTQQSLRALNLKRKDLQIIFQDPYSSMNPRMMVKDVIVEGMRAQSMTVTEARVDELLEMVGLEPEYKYRYPHEFSGGQRQRICIARALAVEPQLIVCDEPTSALDVSVQMHVLQLLNRLQQQLQLTYLLITHDFSVVAHVADEVAVMTQGKIVEHGSVTQILSQPQHEYTQRLLASVPAIHRLTKDQNDAEKAIL